MSEGLWPETPDVVTAQDGKYLNFAFCHYVINKYKASGYTVYLLANSILKIMLHLQMLYSPLEYQQVAPPT